MESDNFLTNKVYIYRPVFFIELRLVRITYDDAIQRNQIAGKFNVLEMPFTLFWIG